MKTQLILSALVFLLILPPLNAQDANSKILSEEELTKLLIPKGPAKSFKEHLQKTQVSDDVLEVLETVPDTTPFIMLNLVRFRPHRDPTLYMHYALIAGKGLSVQGSYTPYYAEAIHDLDGAYGFDNSWDEITIPVYSRFASYGLVQLNPDYQAGLPDRVAGTYERLLYALKDGEQVFQASMTIQKLHDDRNGLTQSENDVIIGEFIRFKKSDGRKNYIKFAEAVSPLIKAVGGEVLLSVEAEIPVVSEELWDHFILTRYPSMEAYKKMFTSDAYIEAGRLRRASVEASIVVPTTQASQEKKEIHSLNFDHVHLNSKDPKTAAAWYVGNLGGKILRSEEVNGAPQIYVEFEGGKVTIRGERAGEKLSEEQKSHWGIDHFGFQVNTDFVKFCDELKSKGVKFIMEPKDFGDMGQVAYIEAPDGVKIELVFYKPKSSK